MYVPEYSRQTDSEKIRALIRSYPFATVITNNEPRGNISHLPLLFDQSGDSPELLIGHLARANPQARDFESQCEMRVIFHGPNAYVSPRWYEGRLNVPTWNYAVVHVTGRPRAVTGKRLLEILDRTTAFFESGAENPWRFTSNSDLPGDFKEQLLRAIVGFEIEVSQVEAKFKLNQNREPTDRKGALDALSQSSDPMSLAVAGLMMEDRK